jgi:ABC-2 type transport system ATP-binding protein
VPLIDVANLEVRYGDTVAVHDVSLSVSAGEIVALLGPNGAGKTTTLEAIQGYCVPFGGTVRVFGVDPRRQRASIASRWGVQPQSGGLPTGLRVAEVVELYAALQPHPSDPARLLELVGLADKGRRPWRRLSGGEQQRLSLAAALVGRPELLILDEPTAAMDPAGRREVGALLRSRAEDGLGVLLATHLLDDVEERCERVVVLEGGRVAASGSVSELTGADRVVTFRGPPGLPLHELSGLVGGSATEPTPGRYRLDLPATPELLASVTAWLASHGATASHLGAGERLDDVFIRLTAAGDTPARRPGGTE